MKKLNALFLSLFLLLMVFQGQSQTRSGGFSVTGSGYGSAVVTDYQCLGINPANLGWKHNSHVMNLGVGESDFSIYSEPLKRELVNNLFSTGKQFSDAERQEAVQNFTDSKLQVEGNVSGFGFSFQDDKIGGFGFSVKERLMWNSNLNEQSADLLFNGYNASYFDTVTFDPQTGEATGISLNPSKVTELFEGTSLEMAWFREYNLSYGRAVVNTDNFSLYAGVGLKYLEGYSYFNYSYKDGIMQAISSLNPILGVEYDSPSPSKIDNNNYQTVGKGFGFDFGVSALLYKKLRLALSVCDIGSIKWDGNVYQGEDALLNEIQTAGINNYNIFELDNNLAFDNLKWGGWEGLENKSVQLPSSFRAGAAYTLNTMFEFGTDIFVPMNDQPGSYDKAIVGVGTRIQPVKWFRGSIGLVSGGNTGTDIPMGISFFPFNNSSFSWEIGVAVRDVTTYFDQNKPTVSMALGLMRFSFGAMPGRTPTEN